MVVLSMALTPVLAELGKATGEWADRRFSSPEDEEPHGSLDEPMSVTQVGERVRRCCSGG